MTNAALTRKLQRLQGGIGMSPGNMPMNPRAFLEEEQDRNRTYLAAELLKIAVETSFANDVPAGAMAAWAAEAVAAASTIFPELSEDEGGAA